MIQFDLFCYTFTLEPLALPQHLGKLTSSSHAPYATRFKCLANMMSVITVKGVFSFHRPENDQQFATSVFHPFFSPCHVIVGLGLMTPMNYRTGEVVFIARFLVPVNRVPDWIFQLQQAHGWWVRVRLSDTTKCHRDQNSAQLYL